MSSVQALATGFRPLAGATEVAAPDGMPRLCRQAAAHWPAVQRWSWASLLSWVPDVPVQLVAGNREHGSTRLVPSTLHAHLRALQQDLEGQAEQLYLKEFDLLRTLPALRNDLGYEELLPRGAVSSVQSWIGPRQAVTGLHRDYPDNVAVQIMGRKRFRLVRPGVVEQLGAVSAKYDAWAVLATASADEVALAWQSRRHGLTQDCFTVDLEPGDVLYIPAGWWHEVTNLTHSVSFGGFHGSLPRSVAYHAWVGTRQWLHRLGWLGARHCTCHTNKPADAGVS